MPTNSDLKTFDDLFARYRPRFVRFAATYVPDQMAAEDIVMESFMSYWERRESLAPGTNPAAYILTAVRNKCLNQLRAENVRRRARQDILSTGARYLRSQIETLKACDPDKIFTKEAEEIVNRTLEALPDRVREVFVLSRFENKTHKEISLQLKIPPRTVEFYISKATKALRTALKDYLPMLLWLL